MITKISGELVAVADERATLAIDAFEYEVLVPEFVRRQLQLKMNENVSLHTIQYLEGNPAQGRLSPRLVGFLSPIEREFFELFCSVDGVGAKKALRAMVRPVQDVAQLIEEQDAKGMSALPGIGAATAERVIAKLRRKMPKFALIVATEAAAQSDTPRDLVREVYEILRTLGHTDVETRKLVDGVLETKKKFKDVDAMINAIYQQQH